ncbi:penicillin-binding protein activator [Candidatus Kaiserbacteria bacterium]|nr:penicillin-binding protein activator [Candidatus Kaiserbacteria bacterium]
MNKSWLWVVVGIVVIGGLLWWGTSNKSVSMTDTGTTYKVGVLLPLSGDGAVYGEPARNIYQIAVDEINATGGINGKPMELVVEDSKCNGQDSANATQKLINIDKVQVIIGGFCSSESLAAVPVVAQAKVALISAGSSSPKLTAISPYFVRNYPSDSAQGSILATVAYNDKGWKKVAFMQEQTDYALGVQTAFSDAFTKLGGTVTNEQFPTETTDFRSIVSKVKGQNPDAVFVSVQTPAVATRIFTQMTQLGWKPKLMVSDTVMGDPQTVSANKGILEGALGAEFGIDATNQKFSGMIASYKAKYGAEPPYQAYAQTEYDSVFIVHDAIAAVGYDGAKIAQWLHTSVQNWQGAAGSVTIGPDGEPAAGHYGWESPPVQQVNLRTLGNRPSTSLRVVSRILKTDHGYPSPAHREQHYCRFDLRFGRHELQPHLRGFALIQSGARRRGSDCRVRGIFSRLARGSSTFCGDSSGNRRCRMHGFVFGTLRIPSASRPQSIELCVTHRLSWNFRCH